jgi:short-subunit dehydrogenase involved in D-alanine esterification of teichoic acids
LFADFICVGTFLINFIKGKWNKLDGLINNAAVFLENDFGGSNADTLSVKVLKQTFETNFFAGKIDTLINLRMRCVEVY